MNIETQEQMKFPLKPVLIILAVLILGLGGYYGFIKLYETGYEKGKAEVNNFIIQNTHNRTIMEIKYNTQQGEQLMYLMPLTADQYKDVVERLE